MKHSQLVCACVCACVCVYVCMCVCYSYICSACGNEVQVNAIKQCFFDFKFALFLKICYITVL